MTQTQELIERLRDVSEWKQIIERHRRITDDPRISYVLKDGTRVHEDEDVIAKLAASLSRALESAADVSVAAADRLSQLEGDLEKVTRWANTSLDSVKDVMWRHEDALKQIHMHLSNHIETHKKVDVAVALAFEAARAALEHQQKGEKL